MNSTYKRLGDYIRTVDVRNRDLSVDTLLGLSVTKNFIPSIANTIGTDMSTYKIVSKGQFVYIADTSRRGDKIAIAHLKQWEKAIVSSVYTVFEVTDESKLMPEYLMLWFKRPEFDRYARFKSHGSAREVFDWEEMCEVMLPVPPIEEQRRIVAEYQAIEQRIENNRQLIAKLEQTAQTIYRKMFVDDIDPENLPSGWRMGTIGEIATCAYGKMPTEKQKGSIPVFSGYGIVGYCNEVMYDKEHIIFIARGDSGSGKVVLSPSKFYLTNLAIAVILKNDNLKYYLYYYLLNQDTYALRSGSAQAQVTIGDILLFQALIPKDDIINRFNSLVLPIKRYQAILTKESNISQRVLDSLLQKLSNN
jgi:type I restriction enzyme S subunit